MTAYATEGKRTQCEIRIKGLLDPRWEAWFEGLSMNQTEAGETILLGRLPDQAALHGLLAWIRDLNLPLISVSQTEIQEPIGEEDEDPHRIQSS